MSFEESLVLQIMRAVNAVHLDAIVIGNASVALQGLPITTQDIDLFVRETPRNDEKIDQFRRSLGEHLVASRPFEPVSRMIRIEGWAIDIDLVFELSSHESFESIRARSKIVTIDGVPIRLANLADVIAAKRAAGRPKDLAALPLLEQFFQVQQAIVGPGNP